jgi:Protein of unknown function (DUF3180)
VKRTAPTTVIAVLLVGAAVGFLLQLALATASLPKLRPEYTLVVTLFLVAVLVIGVAIPVRRSTRGTRPMPVDPFYATRVVILAKASGIAGALLTGGSAGLLIELLIRSGSPSGDSFLRVVLTLASSVAVLVAGLVAEWLCTVPPVDDDREGEPDPTGSVDS